MISFVDADDLSLDDLLVDLESAGPCDIVVGGRPFSRRRPAHDPARESRPTEPA